MDTNAHEIKLEDNLSDENHSTFVDPKKEVVKASYSLILFKNIDALGFFRCVVILLAYQTRSLIRQNGTKKIFDNRKDFRQNFKRFLDSQYCRLSRVDKRKIMRNLKQMLKENCRTESKKFYVNPSNLTQSIEEAKCILEQNGIRYNFPHCNSKKDRVYMEVEKILKSKEIPNDLSEYDIPKYAPLVQDWINEAYGKGTFCLMVLNETKESIWRGDCLNLETKVLPILKTGKEFYPLRPRAKDKFQKIKSTMSQD